MDEASIDPGIRQTVRILNTKGLTTTLSCEGHFDVPWKGVDAWVVLDEEAFDIYVVRYPIKMKRFLMQGIGSWVLDVRHAARLHYDTKIIAIEPRIVLPFTSLMECAVTGRASIKKDTLSRIEQAAERFL